MSDTIELRVNNNVLTAFTSYRCDADLFMADDAFSFVCKEPGVIINPGDACSVYINGEQELSGVIETVDSEAQKNNKSVNLSGRDYMGMLTKACCEEFLTLLNTKCIDAAAILTKDLPYIQRQNIVYQEGCETLDVAHKKLQVEPGMRVFEVLHEYAAMRGLLFYAMPDGTFVFGKARSHGSAKYTLVNRKSGDFSRNNILSSRVIKSIVNSWSNVTIISQTQGDDNTAPEGITSKYTVTNPDFPENFYMPYVGVNNGDDVSPKRIAEIVIDKMRSDSIVLEYSVSGHSQNKVNWSINEICSVLDEDHIPKIKGNYLIYGRTFIKSKQDGTITSLRLGPKGAS